MIEIGAMIQQDMVSPISPPFPGADPPLRVQEWKPTDMDWGEGMFGSLCNLDFKNLVRGRLTFCLYFQFETFSLVSHSGDFSVLFQSFGSFAFLI